MKVLIIEDEPQALEGMKRIMEQLDSRVERSFFCDHGAEAIEMIEMERPDIIVTDIILPDITGLDVLEYIQIKDYEPKVIIVSGFDDFEYAKRGMKLGAIDYFLKPFETDTFRDKILECIDWIEEEHRLQRDHHRAVELAHLGTRSMRDVFLHGLCLQPAAPQEHIVHRLRTWGLEWMAAEPYRVLALTVKPQVDPISEKEEEVQSFATGNIVEELLISFPPSVTFKNSKNYWIVVTPLEEIDTLTDTLQREILRYQKREARIGISPGTASLQALHGAYKQAVDALRTALLSKDQAVCDYDQLKAYSEEPGDTLHSRMLVALQSRDDVLIHELATSFVHNLVLNGRATRPDEISQDCIDWVMELQNGLRASTDKAIGEIPVALWDQLDACESMDDLGGALAHYLSELALQLKGQNKNSVIEQALALIHQNYAQDIKLQVVADALSIHPVWLSQLFKKEVGTNFLDYVTELRIQKSKEYLRQSSLKIYEIAYNVGYQDVHHFGRLFKKKTGMTPKEFRYGK